MSLFTKARGSPYQLLVGAVVLFTMSAAANMASPLYPLYQQAYGMSDWTMTALYAAYVASALPSLLVFGSAADAFGRKPVLLVAVGSVALGTLCFALDGIGLWALFAGRILVGIGLGLGTGAGIALMVEASPVRMPWLGSTTATLSFVIGTGAGPILAGGLVELTDEQLTAPFVAMVGLLIVNALLLVVLRMHKPWTRQRWRPTRPSVPGPMFWNFHIAATTGFLGWSALGIFLALLPSVVEAAIPESNTFVAGMIVGSVLLVSAASQFVAPKLTPRAAQTLGLSMLGIGSALLLSSNLSSVTTTATFTLIVLAAIATGVGHGLSYWGANREIDAVTPSEQRAGITAALYLAFYAGAGLPAVIVGLLSMTLALVDAVMIVNLGLLLATIVFIPIPSLVQTTIRRSRVSTVVASEESEPIGT